MERSGPEHNAQVLACFFLGELTLRKRSIRMLLQVNIAHVVIAQRAVAQIKKGPVP
jgi:hypothetical protein